MEKTKKQKAKRRYNIHYSLRKAGYNVNTKNKTIIISSQEFEAKNTPSPFNKYFTELINCGYGIQSALSMF